MPSTDLPVDIPSPITSSQSSVDTNSEINIDVEASLIKSTDKCASYGTIANSHSNSILEEGCDLLPLPITFSVKDRFAALSKADVLLYQYDPFWTRLRTGMLAFFWLFLLALIVAAGTTAAFDTRACSFSPPD